MKQLIRVVSLLAVVLGISVAAGTTFGESAQAYSGTGYFSGEQTCNRDGTNKSCGGTSMNYTDDVTWHRTSASSSPAIPSSARNKTGFINWLRGQVSSSQYRVRVGAYFVIATMLNERSQPGIGSGWIINDGNRFQKLDKLEGLLNQPRISMTTVSDLPQRYGAISFRGGKASSPNPTTGVSGREDFFFTSAYRPSTVRQLLLFRDSSRGNQVVYVLEIPCGNPVGGFPGLPGLVTSEWRINPASRLHFPAMPGRNGQWSDARVRPSQRARVGQPVTFWHRLDNTGNIAVGNLSAYIQDYSRSTAPPLSNDTSAAPPGSWSPPGIILSNKNIAPGSAVYYHPTYPETNANRLSWTPGSGDAGRWHCQRIATRPASGQSSWRFSAPTCVFVENADFRLDPNTTGAGGAVSVGSQISVQGSVQNTGTNTSYESSGGVIRVVIRRGSSMTPRADKPLINSSNSVGSANWACDIANSFYGSSHIKNIGADRCKTLGTRQNYSFPVGQTIIPSSVDQVSASEAEPGDRLCYITAVNRTTATSSTQRYRVSTAVCYTVGKLPNVQITGGDVFVRSNNGRVITGSKEIEGRRYGSWIEYAAFAPSRINTYTHGALKRGGSLAASPSELTFANSNSLNLGNFAPASALVSTNNLMDNFTSAHGWSQRTAPGTINSSSALPDSFVRYTRAGTVRINQLNNFTRSVVIQADRIIISGNINYANGSYSSVRNLPQVVLKANIIEIRSNVTNVDAWLLADSVSTCGAAPTGSNPYYQGLNINTCDQELTINGPVQADRLFLRRTAGADGTNASSLSRTAEKINLRADAYLWLYGQSTRPSAGATSNYIIRTEYIRELSPRY